MNFLKSFSLLFPFALLLLIFSGCGDTSSNSNSAGNISCATEDLKEGSGTVILCNGDSIGVVYHGVNGTDGKDGADGKDGSDGKDGTGCSVSENTSSLVTIVCGDSSFTLDTNTPAEDSMALVGLTLRGVAQIDAPFSKGTKVVAREVSATTFLPTGVYATGFVISNSGDYIIHGISQKSPYVSVEVENADAALRAIADASKDSVVNVNVVSYLEYDRTVSLATELQMDFQEAKNQARKEVLTTFHTNLADKEDPNTASYYLANMLRRYCGDERFQLMLNTIDFDLIDDGAWNDSTVRIGLADYALVLDNNNMTLYQPVIGAYKSPFISDYWTHELGLGDCALTNFGEVKQITNKQSQYYSNSYDKHGINVRSIERFICDKKIGTWRFASNIEKDTMGFGHEYMEGNIRNGAVNDTYTYVYENDNWRLGTSLDSIMGFGCIKTRQDTVASVLTRGYSKWYKCVLSGTSLNWRTATDVEKDTATWGHDFAEGDVRHGNVNTDYIYVYQDGNWRRGTAMDSLLREVGGTACLVIGDTSKVKWNNRYYVCTKQYGSAEQEWVVAPTLYNDTYENRSNCTEDTDGDLMYGRINSQKVYVCDYKDSDGDGLSLWEEADGIEARLGGCRNRVPIIDSIGGDYACVPKNWEGSTGKWVYASEERKQTYRYPCSGDGAFVDGIRETNDKYVCDADTFRVVTASELWMGKACIHEGAIAKIPSNSTAWVCNSTEWVWDRKPIKGSIVDSRDGNVYGTVTMGRYTWMAEDLKYNISETTSDGLYTWDQAMDAPRTNCRMYATCHAGEIERGICPEGWHVPRVTEAEHLLSIDSTSSGLEALGFSSFKNFLWLRNHNGDSYPSIIRNDSEKLQNSRMYMTVKMNLRCVNDIIF